MTEQQEADCRSVNPFEGDFGNPGDRVLKDKFGDARKAGPCNDCAQQIEPGERVRMLSAIFDGDMRSYRWCSLCCQAMAQAHHGEWAAWESRHALRRTIPHERPR